VTSREIIRKVVERDNPPRVGLTFTDFNGQPRIRDTVGIGPAALPSDREAIWEDDGKGGEIMVDSWGCTQRRLKGRIRRGEIVKPAITDWAQLDSYQPPDIANPARYEHGPQAREEHADKYMLGSLPGCSFNVARKLRMLENYLCDCALYPEKVRRLNRMVNDLVLQQVEIYADIGADGVFYCEDWGTEDSLMINPQMWHEIFKPDFERLINHAHSRGLTVWMHSCGYVRDIIPPLVDLGMDVFQFDQPELNDLDLMADFSDRVTYWCPVDIQKTLQTGDEQTIKAKAREMLVKLGSHGGGFIGKDYPDDFSIRTDPLWQHWAYEVWRDEGKYNSAGKLAIAVRRGERG